MKKTTIMRIASTLLIAVLLTTCAIGATFAKYTAEKSDGDSARVARWAFTFNGADIATTDINFDLFNTTTYTDTAVKTTGNGSEVVIAPGTTGSFVIQLANTSEVAASYSVTFTATNNNIPIEYSLDETTWAADITTLNPTGNLQYGATANDITVYWRWAFTGAESENYTETQTNDSDNLLGTAQTLAEVTVTAKIVATQLDTYQAN